MILLMSLMCAIPVVPPIVVVDRDNVQITQSCSISIDADYIIDSDNNGVLHITGDDVVVDFKDALLHGATSNQTPDTFSGIGIRITGKRVTLKNAHVSGYKGGIYATNANNLIIEDCDISGNYQQRLRSTAKAEDNADWLYPHNNDDNQWLNNYGAGIYIDAVGGDLCCRPANAAGQAAADTTHDYVFVAPFTHHPVHNPGRGGSGNGGGDAHLLRARLGGSPRESRGQANLRGPAPGHPNRRGGAGPAKNNDRGRHHGRPAAHHVRARDRVGSDEADCHADGRGDGVVDHSDADSDSGHLSGGQRLGIVQRPIAHGSRRRISDCL